MSFVFRHWSLDPALAVVAALGVCHEVGLVRLRRADPRRRRWRRRRSAYFYGGLALSALTVVSPIEYWSERYFFVHIVEHVLLGFFAPVLVVAGAPWRALVEGLPAVVRRVVTRGRLLAALRAAGRVLTNPWVALLLLNFLMVLWHLPMPFDTTERSLPLHVGVMDGSFFVAGVLFWLQVVPSPPMRPRASALWQMGAIVGTNFVMFVLAMAMSLFTTHNWYAVYDHVAGVRLSPFADQQIGAAILWVCGDFWAGPALASVVKRAIEEEGSLADAVDRVFHRGPAPALEDLRPPG